MDYNSLTGGFPQLLGPVPLGRGPKILRGGLRRAGGRSGGRAHDGALLGQGGFGGDKVSRFVNFVHGYTWCSVVLQV